MKESPIRRSVALTDAKTRITLIFHNPPWRLKSLKFVRGVSKITLEHQDGHKHETVVTSDEEAVRRRFDGW